MKEFTVYFTRKATMSAICGVVLAGLGHCAFAAYGIATPPLFFLSYVPLLLWCVLVFDLIQKQERFPENSRYENSFLMRWYRVVENAIRLLLIIVLGFFVRGMDNLIIAFIVSLFVISGWYAYCWWEVLKMFGRK